MVLVNESSKILRTILRSNSSVSNCARRSYGIEKQCFRSYVGRYSYSTSSNISKLKSEPFVEFGKVLEKRTCEAKRSILVQVHSKLSCVQLTDYCSTYGQVLNLLHYQLPNMNNFIIVEYERETSVDNLIASSTHFDKHQIIPVRSQFLWFKENLKEKKNRNPSPKALENLPLTISQELLPPDPNRMYSMLNSANDIPDQMMKLFDTLCLDEIGIRMRFLTAQQIQRSLAGLFPAAKALPYGSTVNSYGKRGCDLDIHVQLDHSTVDEDCNGRLVFHAKSTLATSRAQQQRSVDLLGDLVQLLLPGCNHVRKILNARVPILRYKQELTGTECDISVTNMSGVYMSELLYIYGSFDWRVRPLVFTIRFWAQSVNLTSTSPGAWITNFSLTLLVLFFLQQQNILPPLTRLYKLARPQDKCLVDNVNCSFLRDISELQKNFSSNKSDLSKLLIGFFEYYSRFDFNNHAISLGIGKPIPKQEFSALHLVNPLETHLNVSKNVSLQELEKIKEECVHALLYLKADNHVYEKENGDVWGLLHLFNFSSKTKHSRSNRRHNNRLIAVTDIFKEEIN